MSNQTQEVNKELVSKVTINDDGKLVIDNDVIKAHIEAKGASLEEVKKIQGIVNDVTIEVAEAMGHAAVDALVAKKDLSAIDGIFTVGNAKTDMRVRREKEVPISVADRSLGNKKVFGFTELTTTNAIVDAHRSSARKRIQGYATTKLGGK